MYPKMVREIQCADETRVIVASSSADVEIAFLLGDRAIAIALDPKSARGVAFAIIWWWCVTQLFGLRAWIESRKAAQWEATDEDRRSGL
jgi:hypothetical protein